VPPGSPFAYLAIDALPACSSVFEVWPFRFDRCASSLKKGILNNRDLYYGNNASFRRNPIKSLMVGYVGCSNEGKDLEAMDSCLDIGIVENIISTCATKGRPFYDLTACLIDSILVLINI
jgi:hypothetical protein